MNTYNAVIKNIITIISLITLSACLQNSQLRTEYIVGNCLWEEIDCDKSMIEQYPEYDLTFIEFTERGNLYDRESSQKILDYINGFANHDDGAVSYTHLTLPTICSV